MLLVGLALAAVVAVDAAERLLLWRTQLTALYASVVLSKLNASFLTGNVLARDVALAPLPMLVALGALVLVVEIALAAGLWSRRWARPALALAAALHLGVLLVVPDSPLVALRLVVFGGAAVVAYAACTGALRAAAPASVRA